MLHDVLQRSVVVGCGTVKKIRCLSGFCLLPFGLFSKSSLVCEIDLTILCVSAAQEVGSPS
jgi:hypothetical protein